MGALVVCAAYQSLAFPAEGPFRKTKDEDGYSKWFPAKAQRTEEKLLPLNPLCKKICVSIRTGMFNLEEVKCANGTLVELLHPTNDVPMITKARLQVREGRGLAAGSAPALVFSDDLFASCRPTAAEKWCGAEEINARWGSVT